MKISNYSKNLSGILGRKLLPKELPLLEQAFEVAIQSGGLTELDFSRPEGQSYNPRPARIAQILIGDDDCTQAETLAAALLFTVVEQLSCDFIAKNFSPKICSILDDCNIAPIELMKVNNPTATSAAKILCAAWLDRMRHLHLITTPDKINLKDELFSQTDNYITLAEKVAKPLAVLLQAWKDRALRQSIRANE